MTTEQGIQALNSGVPEFSQTLFCPVPAVRLYASHSTSPILSALLRQVGSHCLPHLPTARQQLLAAHSFSLGPVPHWSRGIDWP